MELLESSPEIPDRASQELSVQTSLGVAYTAVKGYGAPEVTAAYARARALCSEVGDVTDLFPVLYGLARSYMLRARYTVALELTGHVSEIAEEAGRTDFHIASNRISGSALFYVGRLHEALPRQPKLRLNWPNSTISSSGSAGTRSC